MAELVHLRLESTLSELEEMKRIGLFNDEEIRKLVKKREHFEYKLRRKSKRKEDYLKYIEYEVNLLSLINKRRERLLCEDKKKEIDFSIAKRINNLFKAAISRFSEDEKLWIDQIQFCKTMNWSESINALHTRLLQIHSKNPALWIMAAKWEMEENNSPDSARMLLQRGIVLNPMSEMLWREYFRMELMYADLIRKRKEILKAGKMEDMDTEENDTVLSGQIANVVYNKAVEAFDDVEFALSLIQICLDFDFGIRHIDYILKDVEERFPDKEETLDALAKRSLLNVDEEIKKGKENGIRKRATINRINEEIFEKYEKAVKTLPTEKMWTFYIEFVLSYLNSASETKKGELQGAVINIMERAASTNCLALSYHSEWTDMLFETGEEDEALSVALVAARNWKTVDLWYKCLTYNIQCMKSHDSIYPLLEEAINSVDEKDSLTLWKLGVEWLTICNPERLFEFFESGIKNHKKISTPLKEMYLEATVAKNGIPEARKLYKRLKKMGSLPAQIVKKMIQVETRQQLNAPIKVLRKYYEDGINEFGSVDVDIWLDYMKLEVDHPEGEPSSYGVLHWRAKKALEPEHLKEFQYRVVSLTTRNNIAPGIDLT